MRVYIECITKSGYILHDNVKSVSYGGSFYSVYCYNRHTYKYPMDQILRVEEVK